MRKSIQTSLVVVFCLGLSATVSLAHGNRDCTKANKTSWKPAGEAEAKAKAAGYEVQKSKIQGTCYEVYGIKGGKLFELFYSPDDLTLKHTVAK